MKPALLLVDVQHDFLARPGLVPNPTLLVEQTARLLAACREQGVPVFHVHTLVDRDGSGRMPHWIAAEVWACVAGTAGCQPPEPLRPGAGEAVHTKRFFDAFGCPALDAALLAAGIDTLILAGLFLHGCIRATALSAYERGYRVWIADDAVGSNEPEHAEITRLYLDGRAVTFLDTPSLLAQLGRSAATESRSRDGVVPAAWIDGRPVPRPEGPCVPRRNPSDWGQTLCRVSLAGPREVQLAGDVAAQGQRDWQRRSADERRACLDRWADLLAEQEAPLAEQLVLEIGKPLADSQGEVRRSVSLVRMAARCLSQPSEIALDATGQVRVRGRPCGVVGLITPWNNPLALAVGKIAPALALGNGVLWKPAVEAPHTAVTLVEALHQAGLPAGLVNLVFGPASTARLVIQHPRVAAVSLTGSIAAGRGAAVHCSRLGKPLQAELGGNNALIVWPGADVEQEARRWALAAFAFAGQRCTAIRRFIVHETLLPRFRESLVAAVESLRLGDPGDPVTEVGPLISRTARAEVRRVLAGAVAEGGRVLCGGEIPPHLTAGCWLSPAVVEGVPPRARVVQEETFGPVAVLIPAGSLEEAIALANGVEQGLVAAFAGGDAADRAHFAEAVDAGMLQWTPGPLNVHPEAPFGGWKASGIGPPEHGEWDRLFYSRPQAIYGGSEQQGG